MADNSDYASTQVLIHRNILPPVALLQRLERGRASEAGQNRGEKRHSACRYFACNQQPM